MNHEKKTEKDHIREQFVRIQMVWVLFVVIYPWSIAYILACQAEFPYDMNKKILYQRTMYYKTIQAQSSP